MSELYAEAKEAFQSWVLAGKVRHGPEFEQRKKTNAKFKYAIRYIKKNEQMMRANSMARKLQQNDVNAFWKDVKVINNSKLAMLTIIVWGLNHTVKPNKFRVLKIFVVTDYPKMFE